MRIYIAGPMRKIALYNFPAFHRATDRWRKRGHEVINPAEQDEAEGFDPHNEVTPEQLRRFFRRDIDQLLTCDAIALIPGWRQSGLAPVEKTIAEQFGLKVFDAETMAPLTEETEGYKLDDEKLRMDLLPPAAIEAVAEILTYGASKYPERNWEEGMRWGRPYAATLRHLFAWWAGEDDDQESGLPHLAHAACNLAFLLHYSSQPDIYRKHDDRPGSQS